MKKLILSLLLLAGSWCGTKAAAWAVTDTVVADGYYYICSNFTTDGVAGKGCIAVKDGGIAATHINGYNCLYIQPFSLLDNENPRSNINSIFHIWRGTDGTYHIKSLTESENHYFVPEIWYGGQNNYNLGSAKELGTYYFRTKDYGSTKGTSDNVTAQLNLTRQDQPWDPTTAQINKGISAGNDTSLLVPASKTFFIVPTTTPWRWRIGGSSLVKNNAYDKGAGASWYLEPVKFDEDSKAWMECLDAYTDALAENTGFGNNPGEISSEVAANALQKALDDAKTVIDGTPTIADLNNTKAAVNTAMAEAKKYTNPINGYYYIRNKYDFGKGVRRFVAPFNDMAPRHHLPSSYTSDDQYADDSLFHKGNSHTYFPYENYLGYLSVTDADFTGTTAEQSRLADKFIWKITQREDGSYNMKNCGESSVVGDSTYCLTVVKRTTMGAGAWCHLPIVGTPHQGITFQQTMGNSYQVSMTDNYFFLNLGVQQFCTMNTCNANTVAQWELYTVPEARITSKFKLNAAITDAAGVFVDWKTGTWPGMLNETYAADLKAELAKARALYAAGGDDATLDAQTAALEKVYKQTLEVLKDSDKVLNPIEEGYYAFVNSDTFNLEWAEKYKYTKVSTSAGNVSRWLPRDGNTYYGATATMKGWKASIHTYATEDNALRWKYQEKYLPNEIGELVPNADYINADIYNTWEFKKAGKNSYGRQLWYIRNLGTNTYLDMSGTGQLYLNDEPNAICLDNNMPEKFKAGNTYYSLNLGYGQGTYLITDPDYKQYMNVLNNAGTGSNTNEQLNGSVGYLTSRANTNGNYYTALWAFEPITGATLDSLLEIGNAAARVTKIHDVIGDAEKALAKTVNFTLKDSLITEAGVVTEGDSTTYDPTKTQIWMLHNQWGEGDYKNLIDGDLTTYVQSRWSAAGGPLAEVNDYAAVVVNLKTPKSKIVFKHGARGNNNIYYGPLGIAPTTYGVTDYGYNYMPVDLAVYGSNDSIGPWTEVSYIKDIPALKNMRIYTSPLIESSVPYQYYKVAMLKNVSGYGINGYPYMAPSYFQVFDAEKDAANSPTEYDSNIKTAASALSTVLDEARTAYAAQSVSSDLINRLQDATDAVNAVAPDTMDLYSLILDARVLRDSTYIEDVDVNQQYGDVTADQKAAFEAAIAKAEQAMLPASHPTQESLKTAYKELEDAIATLHSQKKSFEVNKWYYIVSTEYQNYHFRWNWSWRGNQMVYACGDIPQAPLKEHQMGNVASHVRWGHYTNFTGMPEGQTYPKNLGADVDYTGGSFDTEANPYTMWRIVETGDGNYAIQNRANGLYLGRRQDLTNANNNYVTMSKEPMPMKIVLLGRDQYEILPADSTCAYYGVEATKKDAGSGKYPNPTYETGLPLHSQGADFHIVWWGTNLERGYNTGSAYTFKPVEDPDAMFEIGVSEDNISIMSLPYPVDFGDEETATVGTTGKEAHSYTLKNVTHPTDSTTEIELTYKTKFEAGEPFILVTGNPSEAIEGAHDSINLYVDPADIATYTLDGKTVNGLVATLSGDSIKTPGFGVFEDAILVNTVEGKTTYINGHSGYINPTLTAAGTGNTDAKVSGNGIINAINNLKATAGKEYVDVYTVDGKLVKNHAKSATALKGLAKGIYIIGKKKVIVE